MKLQLQSIFLFYCLSCSASRESDSNANGSYKLSSEDSELAFLNVAALKKLNLKLDDVRRFLCLDLQLGEKFDRLVISSLKKMLENKKGKSVSYNLLKKAVRSSSKIDFKSVTLSDSLRRKVDIEYNEKSGLDKDACSKISVLLMLIYQFSMPYKEDFKIEFDKFTVVIRKSEIFKNEEIDLKNSLSTTPKKELLTEEEFENALISGLETFMSELGKKRKDFKKSYEKIFKDKKFYDLYYEACLEACLKACLS